MKQLLFLLLLISHLAPAQQDNKLRKKDRRRDVELVTTSGAIRLRLYDATPQHRDNFLQLVKSRFYDSILFHRVIQGFMVQSGDPNSRRAAAGQRLGTGGPGYTLPAEIKPELFHQKGALAAARNGDDVNPERRSSASQFYIVQGKTWTDSQMDSLERVRVKRKITQEQRAVYRTTGGTPQLDNQYTIFGYVVKGQDVIDRIAATPVNRQLGDRPAQDVRIVQARLVRRRQ
ncbi:peptidylprolyl isomerase [Cnuella takakiae]|nr:peptidylprolyl isomerase [Cnuella takakiae]OLY94657.1 peptidylprolyl isomerase [Cnuella takakiae]